MKKKLLSEIFDEASKMKIKKERIEHLRKYSDLLMQRVVQGAYHPRVKWLLPSGSPPFKKAEPVGSEDAFHQELSRLYLFFEGGAPHLKQFQREKLFIDMLEKLHPDDAQVLINMKDKKIAYPFLTKNLFNEAFPEWGLGEDKEEGE